MDLSLYVICFFPLLQPICPFSGSGSSPAYCQPICLFTLCLLIIHVEISSMPLPPTSPTHSEHPAPSLRVLFSSLFVIQYFEGFFVCFGVVFFCRVGVRLCRGLCWFIPGVAVGIPHATCFLTCWFASPKQVWSQHSAAWEPSCFSSGMWHGESL
jgi:hypothetical protein